MKIKIAVTLDIDPKQWALAYGEDETDLPAIRESVKCYFEHGCLEQADGLGLTTGSSN